MTCEVCGAALFSPLPARCPVCGADVAGEAPRPSPPWQQEVAQRARGDRRQGLRIFGVAVGAALVLLVVVALLVPHERTPPSALAQQWREDCNSGIAGLAVRAGADVHDPQVIRDGAQAVQACVTAHEQEWRRSHPKRAVVRF